VKAGDHGKTYCRAPVDPTHGAIVGRRAPERKTLAGAVDVELRG
jgi:hypothetical protein